MNKWQDSSLSLGERCVAFAKNELDNGVKETSPNSYTSPRIKEYLSICTRLINGKETSLNLTVGNWCAASVSFCLKNSLLSGEVAPHGYRVGVIEIVSDLQNIGSWKPITSIKSKMYSPVIGDLVIFDRSQPGNPATSWYRHIGRVYDLTEQGFRCISGNSGGTWKISNHSFSQKNLLGFGQYPSGENKLKQHNKSNIDWSSIDISQLTPLVDTGANLAADDFYDVFRKIHRT